MVQALVIVFREAFEAFLIVAVTLAYLRKTGREPLRVAVWSGIAVSIVTSAALGFLLRQVNQPLWEGVLALVAAALATTFVIHLWRTAPRLKQQMESDLERHAVKPSGMAWLGVFGFTVLMITREGMETALMLIQVRQGRFWLGCGLGLLCAAALASLWARFGHRVNLKRFFQVTGLFLLLFSIQIVFYAIHEFSEAEILPNSETIHLLTEPYSADGRYSLWIMFGIVALCGTWLAGVTLMDRHRQLSATSAVTSH
jgi:high-affinity iron transporter